MDFAGGIGAWGRLKPVGVGSVREPAGDRFLPQEQLQGRELRNCEASDAGLGGHLRVGERHGRERPQSQVT